MFTYVVMSVHHTGYDTFVNKEVVYAGGDIKAALDAADSNTSPDGPEIEVWKSGLLVVDNSRPKKWEAFLNSHPVLRP